jgi:hypothetical protein
MLNKAQFWLGMLLFFFVMLDITITSMGVYDRGIGEASPLLNIYILHSSSGFLNGFMLVLGGLITTGWMLALGFVITKIQKIFSMEFFVSMLIIFHVFGILNWIMILK